MYLKNKRILLVLGAGALLAAALVAVLLARRGAAPPEIAFSEFLQRLEAGAVARVTVTDRALEIHQRDGVRATSTPPPGLTATPAFINDLTRKQVHIDVRVSAAPDPYALGTLLALVVLLSLFVAHRVREGRGALGGGWAQKVQPGEGVVTFADVAGVDEALEEVREIVDFLRDPRKYAALGGQIPKGVLLVGPPGTGKTLLARSIAGEAGVPFLYASGADFVEMYAGVGAARVRKLFRAARRHPSCIIFIDELDCAGRRRGGHSLSNEEREQTLNQLLVEMDGFAGRGGTVVIAATNRQDILDPALLRPGRFDRQVLVGCPDLKGREDILRVHSRKVVLEPGVELRAVARGTPGFSGAELANLMNEAALLAARAGRRAIGAGDVDAARDKVLMGVERRNLRLSERERRGLAYHEAGHALVAALLPHADPLHKVTIVPRGRALGLTMQLPEADHHNHCKDYLEAQVAILMGGRVAEELFMGALTTGAANDIERATDIAQRMVCEFGMSPLGPLAFRRSGEEGPRAALSEATARAVDEQVRRIVLTGFETARGLLQRHSAALQRLTAALLEHESLDAAAVRAAIAAASTDDAAAPAAQAA